MGWFLFGKGKKSKSRSRSKSKSAGRSILARNGWNPEHTLLAVKSIGVVAAIVLLVFGWRLGREALLEYTAARHADGQAPAIQLVDTPAWMSESIAQQVRDTVARRVIADPISRDQLENALAALKQCAWVAQPTDPHAPPGPRLQRVGDVVKLDAQYRQPAAVVMAPTLADAERLTRGKPLIRPDDQFHLVDAFGRRLPETYSSAMVGRLGLPVIVRVHEQPPAVGEYWPGEDVTGALKLARTIAGDIYFDQVKAIDAFARDSHGRVHLVLRTDLNSATGAVWGPPPGEEMVYEPNAETKRHRLLAVLEQRGKVDGGGKLVLVNGTSTSVPIERAN